MCVCASVWFFIISAANFQASHLIDLIMCHLTISCTTVDVDYWAGGDGGEWVSRDWTGKEGWTIVNKHV